MTGSWSVATTAATQLTMEIMSASDTPSSVRRALLSVSDKTDLVEFATGLVDLGTQLIASGGTAAILRGAGIAVVDVADVTGHPEMLGGRVKTLHPAIHGGILARRDVDSDLDQLAEQAIGVIDLVVVNLYPFEETAADSTAGRAAVVEQIDIGGPAMIRSAAKNSAHVGVVVDPTDYTAVLDELRVGGSLSSATRSRLAEKAFARTAAYDSAIATWLSSRDGAADPLLDRIRVEMPREQVLRYGENPHQAAALYGRSFDGITQLHGAELSYNNLLDINAGVALIRDISEPGSAAVAIIKHNTPCGVARAGTSVEAYRQAFETDPLSPFGGIIVSDRPIDIDVATAIDEIFTEVVVAPSFTEEALGLLTLKGRRRLLASSDAVRLVPTEMRSVLGGVLVQESDHAVETIAKADMVTRRRPTLEQIESLDLAWRVAKHTKSNAVVFARRHRTLAIGGGCTSRIDAVHFAVDKATRLGISLDDSVVASDAFFPFPDAVEVAAAAGAVAIAQPGGSNRDSEVTAAADRLGLAMVHTAVRHFRH